VCQYRAEYYRRWSTRLYPSLVSFWYQ
jgi:hypothetical protein